MAHAFLSVYRSNKIIYLTIKRNNERKEGK